MNILILMGLIIFTLIHTIPFFKVKRSGLIERLGIKKYKIYFSVISATGLSLMLIARFVPGEIHKEVNFFYYDNINLLMLIANVLIISAYIPKNHFQKYLKHPMLLGILVWSFVHYQVNTNINHSLLFLSFVFFSTFMLIGSILRDGFKLSEEKVFLKNTSLTILSGIIIFIILLNTHLYIAGKTI